MQSEFPPKVWEIMEPSIDSLRTSYTRVTDTLDTALRREFTSTIARLHKVDFSKPVDPMNMTGGGSPYMQDLLDKLSFLKSEVLGKMSMGDYMRSWYVEPGIIEARRLLVPQGHRAVKAHPASVPIPRIDRTTNGRIGQAQAHDGHD